MEEFTQSVKATLYERAKKPFTGTFILAWIAYNWKILVAIFFINEEHLKGITRIDYIEKLKILGINNLVWKPFGIAVVALILLGILNIIASWIVLQFKNFQFTYIDKRIKIDSADYGKLLNELKNIKDKWAEEIQSINTDRANLMKTNGSYKLDNDSLNNDISALRNELRESKDNYNNIESNQILYKQALIKASKLLESYSSQYGATKEDKSLASLVNKSQKSIQIDDIIKNIDNLHSQF
jgi:hypothetical protein